MEQRTYSLYVFRGEKLARKLRIQERSLTEAKNRAFETIRITSGATRMELFDDNGARVWEWNEPHA